MCGIVAYYSKNPTKEHYQKLRNLMTESKVRGLHSFGIAENWENGHALVAKRHSLVGEFDSLPHCVLFHNRYSTSGDYKDHNNNQPISIQQVNLVFNGVISMKDKAGMEKEYGIKMETDNDGEIFIHKILEGTHVDFLKQGSFSFAGVWLNFRGEMYAIRNKNRPLYYLKDEEAIFIASTKDIFKRAGFDVSNAVEITPLRIFNVNTGQLS